ncbi:MAG TPA: NADH-quinone oxidoreductase subunit L [Phycisphaerales bacterium]|nr:NADH-quinone oxidoreductase subunit L [Phycisphaerales bacterium]
MLLESLVLSPTIAAADAARAVGAAPMWVIAIPMLPLLAAALNTLTAIFKVKTKLPAWITVFSLAASFVLTVMAYMTLRGETTGVVAWDWFDLSWGDGQGQHLLANFGFYIDNLTLIWMLFVTGLATLIALYASEYMAHDVGAGYSRFFMAFCLFVFSMACLVMGDNLLLLYLGWEGVGLCSYLLIGYFYKKPAAVAAAKKAFIVNRIGDLGLAIGVMLTFVHFGTVEYAELFNSAQLQGYIEAVQTGHAGEVPLMAQLIPVFLMIGAFGKSAQFPLYVWLPDAMEGPTPVSALIHAATMVTAGVYLIARMYPVFLVSAWALPVVAWIGTITALLAATIGMAQFDIKRIMAYSTVSQLGYMFAGLGMLASTGAVFHVITHAFFKALLFLCCGAVMHGFAGQLDLRRLSGLWHIKGWRIVAVGMLVGCLNLSGVPFTSGFFSKDMIIAESFVTPGYGFSLLGWVLLITAGMTAYYTFRVFYRVFVGPVVYEPGDELHSAEEEEAHEEELEHEHATGGHFHPHAPGIAINTVLATLSVLAIVAALLYFVSPEKHGWVGSMLESSTAATIHSEAAGEHGPAVAMFTIQEHAPASHGEAHAGEAAHGSFLGYNPHEVMFYVSAIFGLLGIAIAAWAHGPRGIASGFLGNRTDAAHCRMDTIAKRFGPIPRWAENKWYVDEFYNFILVRPLWVLGHLFHAIDRLLVDGLVNLFGVLPRLLGRGAQPAQSGILHSYALSMAGGLGVLLLIIVVVTH